MTINPATCNVPVMKSPTAQKENRMFTVTVIATEMSGEYFDGEPFSVGSRQTFTFADWGNAAECELFWAQAGFDTDVTETVEPEVVPNPVVKTTALRAYPGWVVRHYQDGMMDATDGLGVTGGSDSFQEVVAMVRADQPGSPAARVSYEVAV